MPQLRFCDKSGLLSFFAVGWNLAAMGTNVEALQRSFDDAMDEGDPRSWYQRYDLRAGYQSYLFLMERVDKNQLV